MTGQDNATDRRLSCNRIFRHLIYHCEQGFNGKLSLRARDGTGWEIYISRGKLTWATGGIHPRRRWQRQVRLATGKVPNLERLCFEDECWDYHQLSRLCREQLTPEQSTAIIHGTLSEILFDIVQTFELHLSHPLQDPWVPISALTGIGDGMQLQPSPGVAPDTIHRFPYSWMPSPWTLQKQIQQLWEDWFGLGLYEVSPNTAPRIIDAEKLQEQTPSKIFHNLSIVLDGNNTFRDLALRMKKTRDILVAGRIIAPYFAKGWIAPMPIGDLGGGCDRSLASTTKPLAVCVDGNWRSRYEVSSLATQEGYASQEIESAIVALYRLIQHELPRPRVLLVADEIAPLSGQEFCAILRRVEHFEQVPIVVYSEQHKDRKQHKLARQAGVSAYLASQRDNRDRLVALLRHYARSSQTRMPFESAPMPAVTTFVEETVEAIDPFFIQTR